MTYRKSSFLGLAQDCSSTIRPFAQFLDRGPDPTLTLQSFSAFRDAVNGIPTPKEVSAYMQKKLESWYEPRKQFVTFEELAKDDPDKDELDEEERRVFQ